MGISEMSIETMIGVSRLLIAASVMLAVLTVLLFWGFQMHTYGVGWLSYL